MNKEHYLKIKFEKDSKEDNTRYINFEALGTIYEKILDNLKEELV